MPIFEERILECLKEYKITKSHRIAVAVSGGSDSLSLLFAMKNIGQDIVAIHVNHNLREESAKEELYLQNLFIKHDIPVKFYKWHGKVKKNLEQEAREARYAFFQDFCKAEQGIRYLCLAHHSDDQVETFIMNLSRGSSLDGLCCMQERSLKGDIFILRPILSLSKADCVSYLQSINISWLEDETNKDIKFKRNKIRNLLHKIEGKDLIGKRIIDTISSLQDIKIILDQVLEKKFKKVTFVSDESADLSLRYFNKLIEYEKVYFLNKIIQSIDKIELKVRKSQLLNICSQLKLNKKAKTTIRTVAIEIIDDRVYFSKIK